MNVDIARYSCSIPVEGMKNFKEKMGTAAKEVAMPMQSNVSERASDVTAVIVPDTPKVMLHMTGQRDRTQKNLMRMQVR